MLFRSKSLVGLDIGTNSIKLVEVDVSKSGVTLTNFQYVPTPRGSVNGGEIVNVEALAEAIKVLFERARPKSKKVCTGIWGAAIITKKITIPKVDPKLLGDQLKWEAEQYIPFDINEISLDYHILKNSSVPSDQMAVLLVAAKRDFVIRYAEVVELAGFECSIVDVSGFGLANSFEANYGVEKGATRLLLNFGAGVSNLVAIENGEVSFSRDIPVGGQTYTNEIQKSLAVSFEEAEALKISAGQGQPVPQEVTDALTHTNEIVSDEIRRSYDFLLATGGEANMRGVYLTGGGMNVPGLSESLGNILELPISVLNPFSRISYSKRKFDANYIQQIAPYVSVGIGLAMRKVGEK